MTASTPAPAPVATLGADDARRIALRAQGLLGAPDRRGGVRGVLRHLGAVQLDTISVLARSHELIPYARLGAVGRPAVEAAYWGAGASFEYWSHAACILPIEEWPLFAFRRRRYRERTHVWGKQVSEATYRSVLDQLRTEGPLTSTELGGAKKTADWWDWSDTKIAVERALAFGDVVCTERRSWKRVYALAEQAVPAELFDAEPADDECLRTLVAQSGAALGVATRADLLDYHRLRAEQLDAALADSGLVPVEVAGWGPAGAPAAAWADPAALAAAPRGRHRTTLLSPFDSLIWDRARTERIFGMAHRLEAYTPKPKRVHGYFAMPLLAGGRLVGRVDPAREGRTLVARQVSLDSARHVEALATALREAAAWVGCDAVRVEALQEESLRPALEKLLKG
ncbi:crosslink repair DNA glycosylase YcaQ family protein [Streptomyces sp. CB01881]|uniref:winged helix-turn-helix domain-containing protein n=1 Tax=Streptomyces sp. CB01881 TaxID=2078691 RepID=UPI000CDCD09D|nr:crosslink repair DNA glycosylase YcaQ family protein [Streptomyces sp. CB01881]AUY51532.1 cytoplasmic protein [Streptomyces sp. CB01881]TYC74923.1 winged helix-turn-helix domain-containing protein [Streptomyces sp. CB01881]